MAREQQQPMSAARLQEIWKLFELLTHTIRQSGERVDFVRDFHDIKAEVERLRAREAALVDMLTKIISDADATHVDVRPYAGVGHTKIVGPFPASLEEARALLASMSEGSGGDGA